MKITQKGQVTIPQEMRERYGLNPYTEVEFANGENGVIIRPARSKKARFQSWLGNARGSATSGETTDSIMHLTRGED
jgi:AbrB family looped-hinge helix DNA binding protein